MNSDYKINRCKSAIETHGLYGVPYWDINNLPYKNVIIDGIPYQRLKPFSMIVIASSGSGKTALISYIICKYWKHKFDQFVIMSDTTNSENNKHYWNDMPEDKTILKDEYDDDYILGLHNLQKKLSNQGIYNHTLLMMDDFNVQSEVLNDAYRKGRHAGLSVIMCLHDVNKIATNIKQNTTYVVYMKTRGLTHQIFNHYIYPYIDLSNKKEQMKFTKIVNKIVGTRFVAFIVATEEFVEQDESPFYIFAIPKGDDKKYKKLGLTYFKKKKNIKYFNFKKLQNYLE